MSPGASSAVVHVVVAGEVGGAERMLVDLARGASARTHTVALITPSERLRALLASAQIEVDDRGPAREGPLAYLTRSLGRRDVAWLTSVMERRGAAIAHLHTFASQVLGTRAALRVGARIVRTEHSTRVYDDPSCWPFSRWSLRRADAVVCISEHVRRVAEARAPWIDARVRVVANGVDTERFSPAALGPTDGHRDRPVRFVAVGRLDRRKGLERALAALASVDGAELDIVGDGEQRRHLEREAARLGVAARVRFLGFSADVRPAFAACDVALSSARAEGLGIALLEAMAMARPVVALPTGGIPEIVRDGETGWLARGDDVGALAATMRAAVSAPSEILRRGSRAREEVIRRFSVDAMCRGYEAIYEQTLENS
jgi:L-malate glycosyltransferase